MKNETIIEIDLAEIKIRKSLHRACPSVKCHDERPSHRTTRRKYNQNLRNGNYD